METISRNITDLATDERIVMERFVGKQLTENQRIVVQVLDVDGVAAPRTAADYAILADLDDDEADRLTEAMTQRSPGCDTELEGGTTNVPKAYSPTAIGSGNQSVVIA